MLPISSSSPTIAKIGMAMGPTESETSRPVAIVANPSAHSSGQYDGDGIWMIGGAVPVAGPTGANFPVYQNARTWSYTRSGFDQTHILTFNYTYDLPKASKLAPSMLELWTVMFAFG